MKIKPLLLLTFLAFASPISAQSAIDWFTLDGGGGRSSGGAYTLAGTVGQPDAANLSGGNYTLQGGFWSAFAIVQIENAPALRILHSGTNVTLAWPNPSTGFQLEESPSLTTPSWTDVGTAPGVVGEEKQVNQAIAPGTRFNKRIFIAEPLLLVVVLTCCHRATAGAGGDGWGS